MPAAPAWTSLWGTAALLALWLLSLVGLPVRPRGVADRALGSEGTADKSWIAGKSIVLRSSASSALAR